MPDLHPFLSSNFKFIAADINPRPLRIPFIQIGVSAGFPSPAGDYLQKSLDLNEHLIHHPAATFFIRVQGHSMIDANLSDGDLIIVDRSIDHAHKSIVVAIVDGDFTVKRLFKTPQGILLKAENPSYPSIAITDAMDFQVWGVVTHIIHQAR